MIGKTAPLRGDCDHPGETPGGGRRTALSERQPRFEGIATYPSRGLKLYYFNLSERQPRFEGIATLQGGGAGSSIPYWSERQPRFEGIATIQLQGGIARLTQS